MFVGKPKVGLVVRGGGAFAEGGPGEGAAREGNFGDFASGLDVSVPVRKMVAVINCSCFFRRWGRSVEGRWGG